MQGAYSALMTMLEKQEARLAALESQESNHYSARQAPGTFRGLLLVNT